MWKAIAYLVCFVAAFGIIWFGLLSVTTPYGEPERIYFVLGLGISFLVAIIFASIGNSLKWKRDRK